MPVNEKSQKTIWMLWEIILFEAQNRNKLLQNSKLITQLILLNILLVVKEKEKTSYILLYHLLQKNLILILKYPRMTILRHKLLKK